MLREHITNHVESLKSFVPEDRFPIEGILTDVLESGIFNSPDDGEDEHFRPAIVNFQAAFELAAAQVMESGDFSCAAIIHTPGLVKPLTLHAPDHEFLTKGVAPEIYADKARFDTVKIRGERALPAFMKAGGIVIAAAVNTDLDAEQRERFNVHQETYGTQLITQKLNDLPADMVGASYIMRDNVSGKVTFAFIRASQSDATDPRPWIFGMSNLENSAVSKEYQKTLDHFGKFLPKIP